MTRSTDPYAHTELRGLISPHTHPSAALNSSSAGSSSPNSSGTIYPTYVLPASITTIHPQLRDLLVCPKERGRLYYVQGKGITELRVDLEGEREYGEQVREGKAVVGEWAPKRTYKAYSNLLFTPNCLTTSSTLLACGGQNGELHLTTLPPANPNPSISSSSCPYSPIPTLDRPTPRTRRSREDSASAWSMTMTLPNTSINNSFLLLPAYRGNTPLPTRPSSPSGSHGNGTGFPLGSGSGSGSGDAIFYGRRSAGNQGTGLGAGSNGSGVATYPNSVPFGTGTGAGFRFEGDDGAARYMSTGTGSDARFGTYGRATTSTSTSTSTSTTTARSRGFVGTRGSVADDDQVAERQIRSGSAGQEWDGWTTIGPTTTGHRDLGAEDDDMEHDWEGYDTIFPPPATIRSGFSPPPPVTGGNGTGASAGARRRIEAMLMAGSGSATGTVTFEGPGGSRRTLETFSGPSTVRTGGTRRYAWMPTTSDDRSPPPPWHGMEPWHVDSGFNDRIAQRYGPEGTESAWPGTYARPTRARPSRSTIIEYESTHAPIREDEPRLLVSNNDMSVKLFAIRNATSQTQAVPPLRWGEIQNKASRKKLANIGGTKFDTAVNHASVSPDGTTMLVVGDTNDVFLYEIRGGGREFNKIARYEGSRDAGFSTSWSADGRKFVVASQDGQVTVWDHRSSHPLAKLYTSRTPSRSTWYSPDNLYWGNASEPDSPTPYVSPTTTRPPGRFGGSPGSHTPGRRDPARVVKFSPAGSGRELLVFSEETDHIHIADARTFDSQITLRVPLKATFGQTIWNEDPSHVRTAADRGRIGIAGLCFDEKGDFLYAGTESSIVEYDLRLESKRGSGYISMI